MWARHRPHSQQNLPGYFRTDTEAVAFCSLFTKCSLEEEGESPVWGVFLSCSLPSLPPSLASPHRNRLGREKGLITLEAERRSGLKDSDWTAVFAVVFLNALMQAPITRPCLTYFWLRPAIVLFLPLLGHAGVDSNANELSLLLPPTLPSWGRAGQGEEKGMGTAMLVRAGVNPAQLSGAPWPC